MTTASDLATLNGYLATAYQHAGDATNLLAAAKDQLAAGDVAGAQQSTYAAELHNIAEAYAIAGAMNAAAAIGVDIAPPPSPPPPPPPSGDIEVIISAGGMSAAQYQQLKAWGFGGVMGGELFPNGMNSHVPGNHDTFFGNNGQNQFAGATGNPLNIATDAHYTYMRNYKADCDRAHAAGLKYYCMIPFCNIYWSGADPDPTFAAPMLGGWEGADLAGTSYVDTNGSTWADWYRMCADLGDALAYIGADGLCYDNEDNRTQSNVVWWWQTCANNWGNPTDPATPTVTTIAKSGKPQWQHASTQAATQRWAFVAGQKMMRAFCDGRTDLHAPNGKQFPVYGYMTSDGKHGNIPGGWTGQAAFNGDGMGKVYWPKGPGAVNGFVTLPSDQMGATSTWMWWVAGMASQTTGQFVLGNSGYYFPPFTSAHFQYDLDALAKINTTMNASPGGPGGFSLPSNVKVSPYIWLLVSAAVHTQFGGNDWGQAQWNACKAAILKAARDGGSNSYNIYLAQTPIADANYADDAWSSPPGANYTPLNA
jgi:hypothetical protein